MDLAVLYLASPQNLMNGAFDIDMNARVTSSQLLDDVVIVLSAGQRQTGATGLKINVSRLSAY